jgi:MarR family transcriptional regulator for hemolysin
MGEKDLGIFLFNMTRAARHWRRQLDLIMSDYVLTEAKTRPLIYIDRLGDGLRQKDLAEELEIESSSLVRLLDSLENNGLIERRICIGDRRARTLYLTDSGRELVKKVRSLTDVLHRDVMRYITPKEEDACLKVFANLERAFEEIEQRIPKEKVAV